MVATKRFLSTVARVALAAAVATPTVIAAQTSASTVLTVRVQPEAMIQRHSEDSIVVKIRLAERTTAILWRAEVCGTPQSGSVTISRSGVHVIRMADLPGVGSVCLSSSDGALSYRLDW